MDSDVRDAAKARRAVQPLQALQLRDALLKVRTVEAATGLSESSIRRKVAAGEFPLPIKLGARCTRWNAGSVSDWLVDQAKRAAGS